MWGARPFARLRAVRKSERRAAWEQFRADGELLKCYNVKADEMESLRQAALLGDIRSKHDFIFMLGVIRRSRH